MVTTGGFQYFDSSSPTLPVTEMAFLEEMLCLGGWGWGRVHAL